MPERTADTLEHIRQLEELIAGDDRELLYEAALAAEVVLDARGSDALVGLTPIDGGLVDRLSDLADAALGRSAGLGHPEAAAEVAWRIYCAGQDERAEEAFDLVKQAEDLANG